MYQESKNYEFLNNFSVQKNLWKLIPFDTESEHLSLYLNQKYNVPTMLTPYLKRIGINKNNFKAFFESKIKDFFPDPYLFVDMEKTVLRLVDEIEKKRPIGIFGDYDVDGATSAAMLHLFFNYCGLKSFIHIPDRFLEGYGPNIEALSDLVEKGSKLIITVDCGITSFEPLQAMKNTDIDVIIVDHHKPIDDLPPAYSIINPKRKDSNIGFEYLCAAGITFILLVGLNRELKKRGFFKDISEPNLINFLDMVALGTACDVVPLIDLNRSLVKNGLKVMFERKNIGLKSLSDISNINSSPNLEVLNFSLGPRINAGGRIGSSKLGVNLLIEQNEDNAKEISLKLDNLNNKRKLLTAKIELEAIGIVESEINENQGKLPSIILVASEEWHEGVVGIVASKLKDKYNRPACVISITENLCKGSGRSIPGVSLGSLFIKAVEEKILLKGGGHDMAAGLSIKKDKIEDFRNFLNSNIKNLNKNIYNNDITNIAAIASVSSCSFELAQWIEKLGPWGEGVPIPKFIIENSQIKNIKRFGINMEHISFTIFDNTGEIQCKKFNILNTPLNKVLSNTSNKFFNILGILKIDSWNNRNRPEFQLLDIII